MSEPAVEVRQVRRTYTSRKGFFFQEKVETEALRGVDLQVQPGELFGLLGPNGAGKTTLVKILSTLLLPTSGTAKVLGIDVAEDPRRLRPRIGLVLGGERGLYNRISARENLRYFADLYGVPAATQAGRISKVLDTVGLTEAADRRVEEFSRGMKQKLHLARGILHDPELLFLDEPTIGLDPKSARDMRKLIRDQVANGVTVLLTSHYMFAPARTNPMKRKMFASWFELRSQSATPASSSPKPTIATTVSTRLTMAGRTADAGKGAWKTYTA